MVEQFRFRHHIAEVFRDWTELAAAEAHQLPYHARICPKDADFERVEAEYMAVAKKYERKDFDLFAEMLGITRLALDEKKQDFLGRCYMQMEISDARRGQFFTPYEISLAMTRMALADAGTIIAEQGFLTLLEPACGSGGMVIAAAQALEEEQHNPQETLYFEAIDIDRQCSNMAYLQTSLLGLTGIVRHGDTLRMEMRSYRFTMGARVDPARTNRMIDATRSVEEEPCTQELQPTLFPV